MLKTDCFQLGRITKKHSYKGEVVVHLDTDMPEKYQNLESVFLDIQGELVPFFIEESLWTGGQKLRVKFEDIDNEEQALKLINHEVYLAIALLPPLKGKQFYYHEVEGFTAIDVNLGEIGVIKTVSDESSQALFIIQKGDKEILIPAIDSFISKIDRIAKIIYLETPDGLLDLF